MSTALAARVIAGVLVFRVLAPTLAAADRLPPGSSSAPARTQPGLSMLAALEGDWEGVNETTDRRYATRVWLNYRVISNESAVMETLRLGGMAPMVTIYFLDTDHVMATHYCSSNTQPRLRAPVIGPDPRTLKFAFLDCTNVLNSSQMNVSALEVTVDPPHRLTQVWYSHNRNWQPFRLVLSRVPPGPPGSVAPPGRPASPAAPAGVPTAGRSPVAVSAPMVQFEPYERMKALEGAWVGGTVEKTGPSAPCRATYTLISGGAAVMESLSIGRSPEMVTVYHQDGDQLMGTHYCESNSQPRLRTRQRPRPGESLVFEFLDATNVMNATSMNISSLELDIRSRDHLIQTWRSRSRQEPPTIIDLVRKK
ncbi:MAG: hypothetical protein HY815_19870 [Candidatus Riflebacteria bacterium]|nr:hypothetical protein [Candidatus Riflebacteria bacterium]